MDVTARSLTSPGRPPRATQRRSPIQIASRSPDGPDHERPVHEVRVKPFWIDEHEVTVAQFRAYATAWDRSMPRQPRWR